MNRVVPAVLPASRHELEEKLALITTIPSVSRIQIDVVDGRLATPASWPYTAPEELEAMVKHHETLPALDRFEYEIDLMCLDALPAAEAWLALGASRYTFHTESTANLPELLASARKRLGRSIPFGLALNLESTLELVRPCLNEIEYVQFMGIAHIGRQGEPFDERVFTQIETFRALYPAIPFQVDGGVSLAWAKELIARGVSHLVVGSAILRAQDPVAEIRKFETLENSFGM